MSGKYNEELIVELKNKGFRRSYLASMLANARAYQIDALRSKHGLTQSKLGNRANKPQNVISRLENPNYKNPNVKTLLDIAAAFDVALILKFVPFSRFLDEFEDVSPDALQAVSFDEEFASTRAAKGVSKAAPSMPDRVREAVVNPWEAGIRGHTAVNTGFDAATGT